MAACRRKIAGRRSARRRRARPCCRRRRPRSYPVAPWWPWLPRRGCRLGALQTGFPGMRETAS
eukprot:365832-Chlamydomonas_euryale.AAC.15